MAPADPARCAGVETTNRREQAGSAAAPTSADCRETARKETEKRRPVQRRGTASDGKWRKRKGTLTCEARLERDGQTGRPARPTPRLAIPSPLQASEPPRALGFAPPRSTSNVSHATHRGASSTLLQTLGRIDESIEGRGVKDAKKVVGIHREKRRPGHVNKVKGGRADRGVAVRARKKPVAMAGPEGLRRAGRGTTWYGNGSTMAQLKVAACRPDGVGLVSVTQ